MNLAYADPPYIGVADRYPEKTEVDHSELIAKLTEYDGWALSGSSLSLRKLLPLCPEDARVAIWVKTFPTLYGAPRFGWEPVYFKPARKTRLAWADWHQGSPQIGSRILGQKPEDFCFWVFQLLGANPEDSLDDLFPGSGAVGRAWEKWTGQMVLFGDSLL